MLMMDRIPEDGLPSVQNNNNNNNNKATTTPSGYIDPTSGQDIFLSLDFTPSREDVICSRGSISYHHGTYTYNDPHTNYNALLSDLNRVPHVALRFSVQHSIARTH